MSTDITGRDAVEPDAGRYGAAMQTCFERGGASRRAFATAAFLDPSVVTRYFKGQRVAPAEFLTALAAFLDGRGVPLTPKEHHDLDRLRIAALAGSARQHNQALYWREETTRLTAAKEALTARLHEERDRGTHDRRHAAEALGALDLELAELRERLAHTETTSAELRTRHDALTDQAQDQDRRFDAATAYVRELEAELAEHHATIELLRREVDVLRHQVTVLSREQQERQWTTPAHEHVAQAATQVGAVGVAGDYDRAVARRRRAALALDRCPHGSRPRQAALALARRPRQHGAALVLARRPRGPRLIPTRGGRRFDPHGSTRSGGVCRWAVCRLSRDRPGPFPAGAIRRVRPGERGPDHHPIRPTFRRRRDRRLVHIAGDTLTDPQRHPHARARR